MVSFEEKKQEVIPYINQSIYELLKTHAYLGHLFQSLNRVYSTQHSTAWVTIQKNRFIIGFNPYFMGELSQSEKTAVIMHELGHLLSEHLSRLQYTQLNDARLNNVASDFAVNSWVKGLPKIHTEELKKQYIQNLKMTEKEAEEYINKNVYSKPDKDGKVNMCLYPEDYNLPVGLTAEEYYVLITQNEELKKQFSQKTMSLSDIGQMTQEEQDQLAQDIKDGKVKVVPGSGSHEGWSNKDSDNQIVSEELKRILKDALNKAGSYGNLPGDLVRQIEEFIGGGINWRVIYSSFINYATQVFKESSRKKRNRRYGISYPGKQTKRQIKVAKVIDTSGSIGIEDLSLIAGELNKAFDLNMSKIDIISADTEVHECYTMKQKFKPETVNFKGGGGTDASKWIEFVNTKDYDCCMIVTDGYFDYQLPKCNIPVLWCLTVNGMEESEFKQSIPYGSVLKLKGEQK